MERIRPLTRKQALKALRRLLGPSAAIWDSGLGNSVFRFQSGHVQTYVQRRTKKRTKALNVVGTGITFEDLLVDTMRTVVDRIRNGTSYFG